MHDAACYTIAHTHRHTHNDDNDDDNNDNNYEDEDEDDDEDDAQTAVPGVGGSRGYLRTGPCGGSRACIRAPRRNSKHTRPTTIAASINISSRKEKSIIIISISINISNRKLLL